jgi:hypothetical protein
LENGAIAQLGERFNGIEEVVGSIPSGSTKSFNKLSSYSVDICVRIRPKIATSSPPRSKNRTLKAPYAERAPQLRAARGWLTAREKLLPPFALSSPYVDTLVEVVVDAFDCVLMNEPFCRQRSLSRAQRQHAERHCVVGQHVVPSCRIVKQH